MKKFNCDECKKDVFEKGVDWDFVDDNLKDTPLLEVNLNLIRRVCFDCIELEKKNEL